MSANQAKTMSKRDRKERPLCRLAIEKFGLRFAADGKTVLTRDGAVTGASKGIRIQLHKQEDESED
jgi:hypothetical protein